MEKLAACCSFCHRPDSEVVKLIGGVDKVGNLVYICNECVDLCRYVLKDENEKGDGLLSVRREQLDLFFVGTPFST